MIALTVALALADEPMPALRRTASHVELRTSVPIVQELTYVPGGREIPAWTPALGVTAVAGKGSHLVRGEAALHGAIAFSPWGPQVRLEPRGGVRFAGELGFGSVGLGASMDRGGVVPVAHGAIGWTGEGARLRPVVAVEGRYAVPWGSEYSILLACAMTNTCPIVRAGGTGVLASVGLQWPGVREGVRP